MKKISKGINVRNKNYFHRYGPIHMPKEILEEATIELDLVRLHLLLMKKPPRASL
jgi:hypothetical protein